MPCRRSRALYSSRASSTRNWLALSRRTLTNESVKGTNWAASQFFCESCKVGERLRREQDAPLRGFVVSFPFHLTGKVDLLRSLGFGRFLDPANQLIYPSFEML